MATAAGTNRRGSRSFDALPPLPKRAALVLLAWFPAIILAVVGFPRFVPIFDRLRQRQQLPQVTEWAMTLARLGTVGSLMCVLALVALIVWAGYLAEKTNKDAGRIWYCLAIVSGLVAFFAGTLAVLLPVFEMRVG
jgi:hypothetical protein